jgi:fructosamine-3-kinase
VRPSLRWVLQDSGAFPDLPGLDQLTPEQVVALGGGVDAATYLVRCPGRDVVVKLKSGGLEAEARALRAWKPYTPRVPKVLGLGTVPSVGEGSMKYLVLAALTNAAGRIVEAADAYLDRSPTSARELGRALGAELQRMHQAVDETGFGNFADSPGSERTYRSWAGYLEDFLASHADLVRHLGIGEDRMQATLGFMRACPFVAQGRFLHGDVSVRNVGIFHDQPSPAPRPPAPSGQRGTRRPERRARSAPTDGSRGPPAAGGAGVDHTSQARLRAGLVQVAPTPSGPRKARTLPPSRTASAAGVLSRSGWVDGHSASSRTR